MLTYLNVVPVHPEVPTLLVKPVVAPAAQAHGIGDIRGPVVVPELNVVAVTESWGR